MDSPAPRPFSPFSSSSSSRKFRGTLAPMVVGLALSRKCRGCLAVGLCMYAGFACMRGWEWWGESSQREIASTKVKTGNMRGHAPQGSGMVWRCKWVNHVNGRSGLPHVGPRSLSPVKTAKSPNRRAPHSEDREQPENHNKMSTSNVPTWTMASKLTPEFPHSTLRLL
jgi:hypothetical protein